MLELVCNVQKSKQIDFQKEKQNYFLFKTKKKDFFKENVPMVQDLKPNYTLFKKQKKLMKVEELYMAYKF